MHQECWQAKLWPVFEILSHYLPTRVAGIIDYLASVYRTWVARIWTGDFQNASQICYLCGWAKYKVVQIWPGLFVCKQSRSYLNHLVFVGTSHGNYFVSCTWPLTCEVASVFSEYLCAPDLDTCNISWKSTLRFSRCFMVTDGAILKCAFRDCESSNQQCIIFFAQRVFLLVSHRNDLNLSFP